MTDLEYITKLHTESICNFFSFEIYRKEDRYWCRKFGPLNQNFEEGHWVFELHASSLEECKSNIRNYCLQQLIREINTISKEEPNLQKVRDAIMCVNSF